MSKCCTAVAVSVACLLLVATGANAVDTLNVTATAGPDVVTVAGNMISGLGPPINFTGIKILNIDLAGGDDQLTVTPMVDTTVNADGGANVDTLIVDALGRVTRVGGNSILVMGFAPIHYLNFEHVTLLNAQVAATAPAASWTGLIALLIALVLVGSRGIRRLAPGP